MKPRGLGYTYKTSHENDTANQYRVKRIVAKLTRRQRREANDRHERKPYAA